MSLIAVVCLNANISSHAMPLIFAALFGCNLFDDYVFNFCCIFVCR